MLSIALAGGFEQAVRTTGRVRLITHAVSLGGVDSLIQCPAALTHRPVPAEARPAADILRLSIGLEDAADLQADLDQALRPPVDVPFPRRHTVRPYQNQPVVRSGKAPAW